MSLLRSPRSLPWRATASAAASAAALSCLGVFGLVQGPEAPVPDVRIVWPREGAVLGGDVNVFVPVAGVGGVSRLEVWLDDTQVVGVLPGDVYALSWDTRGTAVGAHTLQARAYDSSGRTLTSAPVHVTVDVPLALSVSSSGRGAGETGALSLHAAVDHARGEAWVQFLTEDTYLCGVQGPPYTCDAPTEGLPAGPLAVRAEVYDEAGNHALSEWVTVLVDSGRGGTVLSLTSLTLPAERVRRP